jgi:hypothetical protein
MGGAIQVVDGVERVNGSLNMSRALGNHTFRQFGVISGVCVCVCVCVCVHIMWCVCARWGITRLVRLVCVCLSLSLSVYIYNVFVCVFVCVYVYI